MKNLKYLLLALFALTIGSEAAFAQPQQAQQPGQGGPPNWQSMDPQQIQQMMQQRIMSNFREQLAVTNDDEWGVIQDRLQKVLRLKMDAMMSGGAGMWGGMRRPGGNGPGFRAFQALSQPDPSADSLRNAIDNAAPNAQVKAALEKFRDSRKQKQAELAKAQEDLRSVLTVRQEAALVLAGMLD